MTIDTTTLRDRAEAEGQAHLFQFWDGLDAGSRERSPTWTGGPSGS